MRLPEAEHESPMSQFGAYCHTAGAIVPIPEDNTCDWCGGRHAAIRYKWNGTEWESIVYDDAVKPALLEKPENFMDDPEVEADESA